MESVHQKKLGRLEDGQTGGVYALSPSGRRRSAVAIFKPEGEEGFKRRCRVSQDHSGTTFSLSSTFSWKLRTLVTIPLSGGFNIQLFVRM